MIGPRKKVRYATGFGLCREKQTRHLASLRAKKLEHTLEWYVQPILPRGLTYLSGHPGSYLLLSYPAEAIGVPDIEPPVDEDQQAPAN